MPVVYNAVISCLYRVLIVPPYLPKALRGEMPFNSFLEVYSVCTLSVGITRPTPRRPSDWQRWFADTCCDRSGPVWN